MTVFFGLQCRNVALTRKHTTRYSAWILGSALLLHAFTGALVVGTSTASALDLNIDEIRGKSSKEPVSVLQNRYFLKAWRPEIGLMVGTMLDEAYIDTTIIGVRAGMFVSEWLGFEFQMFNTSISDSDDRKALNKLVYRPLEDSEQSDPNSTETITVTPDPEVNAIHKITDFTAVLAPFYGKLNLMNKLIVYTDIYLTAGLSRVQTDQGDKNAILLGAGERFYFGKAWSLRIDFKDRIYSETRAGEKSRKHSYSVDLGVSYFFR